MTLGWTDWAVLCSYFAATVAIGFWFGRGESDTAEFFLGGRRQHWLLAGMSIIATEVSALTLIAVPAEAYRGDWSYLQLYAGSFVGRIAIAFVLLPTFYRAQVTTVYEYLGQRFGPWTRLTASLMFFASRILGSGIRLLVASLAVAEVFGWSLEWVVFVAAGIAVAYASFGGIKAIMWTDAFQAIVFVAAALVTIAVLFALHPGSWSQHLSTAYEAGKFHTITPGFRLDDDKAFWVLSIHAFFTTMAAMGTDQDLTQRMLTCRDARAGQRSLLFNAFTTLPIVCVFLLIGSLLYVYYQGEPVVAPTPQVLAQSDRILPFFIATAMPENVGLKGLLLAAIFAATMSSLSSAVGALATTAINDLYRPWAMPGRPELHYVLAARLTTVLFGFVLASVALAFADYDKLLWEVFKWVSLVFGGMLGIFLLGVTTRHRGQDATNMIAMLSSVAMLVAIKQYQEPSGVPDADRVLIAWPWWVVLGTVWTFGIAAALDSRRST